MLSNKNNLRSELTANVGVLATTISITAGEGVLWENNMVACLEHYEGEICTKREIIKITAKNNDTFTITRGFAVCIMNDQTKQQGQGSQEFVVGDYLSLYLSKEIWESLTTGITTNETNIQTMVARINAPRTCIENNCQTRKNCIDDAYVTKFGGNAGFGTGADGDCVITEDTFLCANREYNFNNLTICEGVTVRFCGIGTPTINVWKDFRNCGVLDMRAPYLQARTCKQTDCWLHKGTEVCNQCESLSGIASEGGLYCGGAGGGGTSAGCDASDGHGGNGGSGEPYDGCNGGNGGTSGCYGTGGGGAFGVGTGGAGGTGRDNGGNGGNGFYGGRGGDATRFSRDNGGGGAGGVGVARGGDAGGGAGGCEYNTFGNGGNAITNVYGLHLNARNIYNKCVNSKGGDGGNGGIYYWYGTSGGYAPSGGCGGNGANGGQILVSYDCMYEQGCFDVSGGKGGTGAKLGFSSESYWRYEQPNGTDGTAGWVVFRNLNNPYIQNFNLENDEDNEAILISWKDPSFKPGNQQQRAKTVVRYSTTNYPTTPTDGTLAVQETTKNQYENTPYSLTGVLDETTYYFSIFALDQNNTIIDVQTNSITTEFGWKPGVNTVAYFPLNTDLLDHGPNQYSMTNYGSVTINTEQVVGKGVAYFNGSSMLISSSSNGLPTGTNPKTLSCWVKNWGSVTSGIYCGFGYVMTSHNNQSFLIGQNSGKIHFSTWGGGYDFISNVTPTIGQRYNLIASYNGSTYTLYINGTANISGSLSANTSSTYICIGSNSDTRSGYWLPEKAYISEVIIENVAWSSQDVLDYYNKTKSKYGY